MLANTHIQLNTFAGVTGVGVSERLGSSQALYIYMYIYTNSQREKEREGEIEKERDKR